MSFSARAQLVDLFQLVARLVLQRVVRRADRVEILAQLLDILLVGRERVLAVERDLVGDVLVLVTHEATVDRPRSGTELIDARDDVRLPRENKEKWGRREEMRERVGGAWSEV